MPKTSHFSTARPRRYLFSTSAAVALFACLISVEGCGTFNEADDGVMATGAVTSGGGSSGSSGAGGLSASGGSGTGPAPSGGVGTSGGTNSTGGATSAGGVTSSGANSSGGTPRAGAPSGGAMSGGANGGGMDNGGSGIVEEPCEDIEPPPDPEWPGATCLEWALETNECDAAWFSEYCDVSCGRCVPEGGVPDLAPDCSGEGLPDVTGGEGFASRYWDCCQTHCAQSNGHRCGQDGVSSTGDEVSACSGGGSFACYDEAPRAVSDCLSYGHIAKTNPNCGACYRIQFTGEGQDKITDPGSMRIKGKQMIVKVTNTGSISGNQFDLMVPGGGVGQFNACSRQWGTNDLGAQYGGFLTTCSGSYEEKKACVRQECMKIPGDAARDGCFWFVDWFEIADNPKFTSQPTDCPF